MSIIQLLPQQETLRVEVSARTEHLDRIRGTHISTARLVVYSAWPNIQPRFSVTIKGPVWHQTGLPPFSWQFITGDLNNYVSPVLRIFLAPGAYIERINDVFERARMAFLIPQSSREPIPLGLEVIRVGNANLLPELGRPISMPSYDYSPIPWSYLTESFWNGEGEQGGSIWQQTSTLAVLEHEPTVRSLPDGLLITKIPRNDLPGWQVRITTPLDEPAAFAYNLFGPTLPSPPTMPSADFEHLRSRQGQYTLRVVKTLNVDIELVIERSRPIQGFDIHIEYHVVDLNDEHRTGEPQLDLTLLTGLTDPLRTAAWNYIGFVPVQGMYLDPQRHQFYTLSRQNQEALPVSFRGWSHDALDRQQVVGDPISIQGRHRGNRLGRVAPRLTADFTPDIQLVIAAFEITIGLIPIIGTIYDVASILYLSTTGRSLWGERRDITYWDLLGLGGIGLGPLGDVGNFRRAFEHIANVYDRANSIRYVVEHLDPPVRRSSRIPIPPESVPNRSTPLAPSRPRVVDVSAFNPTTYSTRGIELIEQVASRTRQRQARALRDLTVAIEDIGLNIDEVLAEILIDAPSEIVNRLRRSTSASDLARELLQASGGDVPQYAARLIEYHDLTRLLTVFTPDFSEFTNDVLAKAFHTYRNRKIAEGRVPLAAIEWAKTIRTGQAYSQLSLLMGTGYRRRIERWQSLSRLSNLDSDAMRVFEELRRRIQSYEGLVRERTARRTPNADPGTFFDADHLLEKRFIHRIREILPNFDTDSLQALLVPKNQAVLQRMRALDSGLNAYDHSTKTQLMRALIPYGEQHLFSLQQWWDAHVWVYRQLVTENLDEVLGALETDFRRLAPALGEPFEPHRTLPNGLELLPRNQIGRASSFRTLPQ